MKAIILAAGTGSRLRPLTDHCPKCLLTVHDKPILDWILHALLSCGIHQVMIVTGYLNHQIENHLKNHFKNLEIEFCFNPLFETTNNAYSLKLALQKNSDEFILIDGDLIFSATLLQKLVTHPKNNILLYDPRLELLTIEAMKIKIQPTGQIEYLSKQMPFNQAIGESIGLARLGKEWAITLKNWTSQMTPDEQKSAYYEDGMNCFLPDKLPLYTQSVEDELWIEIDTQEDLEEAQRIFIG